MIRNRKSKVRIFMAKLTVAVTLDGTVIHKSGLITGGQGANANRKFSDTEITSETYLNLPS
jgi:chromosome segregation ATPase